MTEVIIRVRPGELRPGDLLNLEGDIYADFSMGPSNILCFEYAEVEKVWLGTVECVVETNYITFRCPPMHEIKTLREVNNKHDTVDLQSS